MWFIILWLFFTYFIQKNKFIFVENITPTYIPPVYQIAYPNITSGGVYALARDPEGKILETPDVLHLLGTVCSMAGYNTGTIQKRTNLNLKVNFNLFAGVFDLGEVVFASEYMDFLETSLYRGNRSSAMSSYPQIGTILGNAISNPYYYYYVPFFKGVKMPTIGQGFTYYSRLPLNTIPFSDQTERFSVYELGAATGPILSNALTQLLKYLNWTLISVIFTDSDFGYYGQELLQFYQSFDVGISVACPTSILLPSRELSEMTLKAFTRCIANVKELEVICLWMTPITAAPVIQWFRDNGYDNLNFFIILDDNIQEIIKGRFQTRPDALKNVLFFQPTSVPLAKNLLEDCVETLEEGSYVKGLGEFVLKCINEGKAEFQNCNSRRAGITCYCDENMARFFRESFSFFGYSFDAVSLMANGISLLQNNCTYLNEFWAERKGTVFSSDESPLSTLIPDFCTLKEFTPLSLNFALRAVNFSGLTGPVAFERNSSLRAEADLGLMQYNNNLEPIRVGEFINGQIYVNISKFNYSKFPVSEIVVQIPDLNVWFVGLFFGITCFLIVVDFTLWAIITYYRKDKFIKRCSPFFMALVTLGIMLVLISNILFSIGLTSSAMCILTNFFLLSGLSFIVANILAKNYRVYKIFSNPSATAVTMNDQTLFVFTLVIVGVTWIVWAITSFADGPIKVFVNVGADNPFYTYGYCRVKSQWFQDFQIIFWYVYFIGLFLLTGLLGFLTRNVHGVFNESLNVTTIAFGYIAFAIIFAPLYYIQSNTTNSNHLRWVIQALSVCFLSTMTMAILLCPTLWKFYKLKRKND